MSKPVICGRCGRNLVPNTPEEEAKAQAEYEKYFPNAAALQAPRVAVCEDCYKQCSPAEHPIERAISEMYPELN